METKTKQLYTLFVQRLMLAYQRQDAGPHTSLGLAVYLISLKGGMARATWRLYKAAALQRFGLVARDLSQGGGHDSEIQDLESAIDLLKREPQTGALRTTTRTSATKAKKFPEKDFDSVRKAALAIRSKYGQPLADYLMAGRSTGLRPCEWATTSLVERHGAFILRVKNAKLNETRGNGRYRHLTFQDMPLEEQASLLAWQHRATTLTQNGQYEKLLKGIAGLLRRICDRLFPKRGSHFALYSTRHQFAADAKRFYSKEEVAALMGHSVDTSASAHYGRLKGSKNIKMSYALPMPAPREVEMVRRRHSLGLERLKEVKVCKSKPV